MTIANDNDSDIITMLSCNNLLCGLLSYDVSASIIMSRDQIKAVITEGILGHTALRECFAIIDGQKQIDLLIGLVVIDRDRLVILIVGAPRRTG